MFYKKLSILLILNIKSGWLPESSIIYQVRIYSKAAPEQIVNDRTSKRWCIIWVSGRTPIYMRLKHRSGQTDTKIKS